jgi:transcriptional regulator with XRE-family HTH domain
MREKVGLSQMELARRARLSLRSIQNWEQGHRLPRAQALLALARGVGVSVEKLLAGIAADRPSGAEPPAAKPARKPKGRR